MSDTCTTCGRPASDPYRLYDANGHVRSGCVDDAHTGHLVTPSESSTWHNRSAARQIRKNAARGRSGKGYAHVR